METYAIHKGAMIAPLKARMTMDLIRNKSVNEARAILATTNTKASRLISKVLDSAIANATNNFGANAEELFVSESYINEGRGLRRPKVASKGRANIIIKRASHIYVKVSDGKLEKED